MERLMGRWLSKEEKERRDKRIFSLTRTGVSYEDVARIYGMSKMSISRIITEENKRGREQNR
jgi:Mor family transcriptional regulator